jgi:hypothetical protein
MKIDVIEKTIRLKEVTKDIILETDTGLKLLVIMKNGNIELGVNVTPDKAKNDLYKWYKATKSGIEELNLVLASQQALNTNPEINTTPTEEDLNKGRICQYCKKPTQLIDSDEIYGKGKNFGKIKICKPCDAYVKVNDDNEGKGRVANKELRTLRKDFHTVFEPLYDDGLMSKKEAYKLLLDKMGIRNTFTNVTLFTNDECLKAIEVCKELLSEQSNPSLFKEDEE